jgi:hypothetical protein
LERRSIAGEIQHRSKKKETRTPSITDYDPHVWKKQTHILKPTGHYKQESDRTNYFDDKIAIDQQAGDNTFLKHKLPTFTSFERVKNKPRYTKIEKQLPRFPNSTNNSPTATQYETVKAIEET